MQFKSYRLIHDNQRQMHELGGLKSQNVLWLKQTHVIVWHFFARHLIIYRHLQFTISHAPCSSLREKNAPKVKVRKLLGKHHSVHALVKPNCTRHTPFTHGAPSEGWWRPSKVWGQRYFVPGCLVCLVGALSGQRTSLLHLSRHQLETSHVAFCCVVLVACVNCVALCKTTLHSYCDFLFILCNMYSL